MKSAKKFIGLRVDGDKAEQLAAMADDRGVSVNELLNSVLDELPDSDLTAEVADRRVTRGISQGNEQVDALVRRFDVLDRLVQYLEEQRESLESEKPDGLLEDLFGDTKRLREWQRRMEVINQKLERLTKKLAQVGQRLEKLSAAEDDLSEDSDDERPAAKRRREPTATRDSEGLEGSDDFDNEVEEQPTSKRKARKPANQDANEDEESAPKRRARK